MIGLLVVTHGGLAAELVAAMRRIVRAEVTAEALSIDWDDDVDESRERLEAALGRVDQGEGVLICTDMFGGTPTNLAMTLFRPGAIEVVTGVNLPMLIKFTNIRTAIGLGEAARLLADKGRSAITVAGEILAPPAAPVE